jgi:hypothetical protein
VEHAACDRASYTTLGVAFHAPGPALKKDQPLEAGSADGRAACGRAS